MYKRQLLGRARAEGSQDLDSILDRTLDLMHRQVDNLREIAQEFYQFTGGRKPTPEDFELMGLVEEVLQLHAAWAAELGVEVRTAGDGTVHADPGQLRQVLVNLVSNAFQAMPEGGELEIETRPRGAQLELEIRDTGKGIGEDAREHLFEPYFTTRSEGTGLGLAIAKRVIEEMDGEIALEPREGGVGTVVRLRLPRRDPA